MAFQGSIQDLQVAEVIDSTGDKVGKVGQVYLTNDAQEPSWVTVNTGLFGTKETFIPLADASYADGVITVPYEKSFIKDAPRIDDDGEISREEEDELYRYYGVADGPDESNTTRDAVAGGAGYGVNDRHETHELNRDEHRKERDLNRAETHEDRAVVDDALGEDRARDRNLADADRDLDKADGVTLHEEQVEVGTESREVGKARLRKYVVNETRQVEVPVQREEVVLEREPATGTTGGTLGEDEVEVSLTEEQPVIRKETVATENVSLGKRAVEDTETVTTEVGHEEVDVEGADVRNDRDGRGL